MQTIRLALVGFGNVGRAFAKLLMRKEQTLSDQYGLSFIVTGIATGRHGWLIDPNGIDLNHALALAESGQPLSEPLSTDIPAFIAHVPADVLFENSPVNHHTGQPAVGYLHQAIERGMHTVTANKGPVVHAHRALTELAELHGRRFMFESAVMDGAPIFSLFRGPLPAAELIGFSGILNSCTNFMLGLMEQGKSFDEAVVNAQAIGIAETDPSADVDGWDAAIKVAALSSVLMGVPLLPQQVDRTGIRGLTPAMLAEANAVGQRYKLVCTARREGDKVLGRVAPQRVAPDSPLFSINGTSSYVQFELDVLPGLGIVESNPGPVTTAYGLLADLINIYRGM